jgi:hypothetical protein
MVGGLPPIPLPAGICSKAAGDRPFIFRLRVVLPNGTIALIVGFALGYGVREWV